MPLLDRWEEGKEGRDEVKHPKAGKGGGGGKQCSINTCTWPPLSGRHNTVKIFTALLPLEWTADLLVKKFLSTVSTMTLQVRWFPDKQDNDYNVMNLLYCNGQ